MVGDVANIIVKGESKMEGQCVVDLLLLAVDILVVRNLLAHSAPVRFTLHGMTNAEHHGLHAGSELTVHLLEIDDIEAVGHTAAHVGHFEVEPLMIAEGVDVRSKNQIVFVFGDLVCESDIDGTVLNGSITWIARLKLPHSN